MGDPLGRPYFFGHMLAHLGLDPGKILVVGVSGGPDSLALLHYLLHLGNGPQSLPYPLLVASFNHRLRPEAEADVAFVQQLAAAWGLPFVTDSADVGSYAEGQGLSLEEAARELRYRFLFRVAREAGAQAVAVGHTADDQAETVLMHFLRGAGLSGLKGITPRVILPVFEAEIPLVRPLLNWTRAQTEAYCRKHGLTPRLDETNADTTYFRNHLRHELLPELEKYNPQIRQTLAKTALTLQGDYELLNELIEAAWQKAVTHAGNGFVEFERRQLEKLAPALRRNLLRKAAFLLQPGLRDVDFEALERAATLKPVDLAGGLKTILEGEKLFLTADEASLPCDAPWIGEQLSVTGDSVNLGNGWALMCEPAQPEDWSLKTDHWSAWFDADLVEGRLQVRPVRAGDRFEPLGMRGQTVKLSDLFVNLKIPKRLRKNWPVVCVGEEIAWVVGLRRAEKFKVTEKTLRIWKIQVKKE
jgi:tRNA(Ile)-lysidine synthase